MIYSIIDVGFRLYFVFHPETILKFYLWSMIWVKKRLKAVPLIPSLCRWLWNRSSLVRCSDCAGVQPPCCVLKDCSSCVVVSPRPLEILITRSVFFITLVLVICSPTCHTTHLAASDNWQGRCRSPDAQWRVIWAFGCIFLQFGVLQSYHHWNCR